MILAALGLLLNLTYLWDTAEQGRLILLIVLAMAFGFVLAQVPAMKSLMHGRTRSRLQRTGIGVPGVGTEEQL